MDNCSECIEAGNVPARCDEDHSFWRSLWNTKQSEDEEEVLFAVNVPIDRGETHAPCLSMYLPIERRNARTMTLLATHATMAVRC